MYFTWQERVKSTKKKLHELEEEERKWREKEAEIEKKEKVISPVQEMYKSEHSMC